MLFNGVLVGKQYTSGFTGCLRFKISSGVAGKVSWASEDLTGVRVMWFPRWLTQMGGKLALVLTRGFSRCSSLQRAASMSLGYGKWDFPRVSGTRECTVETLRLSTTQLQRSHAVASIVFLYVDHTDQPRFSGRGGHKAGIIRVRITGASCRLATRGVMKS